MDVSIIIPTYNQNPSYLYAAIRSALGQTTPCQVIVVDDGSDPPQQDVITRSISLDARFADVVYTYQENKGVAGALNTGIGLADTNYVAWLSSDDLYRANNIENQLNLLKDRNGMVSYCAWEEGVPQLFNTWPAIQYPSQEKLFHALQQHCFINACTILWSTDVFQQLGGFNENYAHTQDYHMIIRTAEKWNFEAINEPMVRRRVHPGQMINTLKDETERLKKIEEMDKLKKEFGVTGYVWVP